MSIEYYIGKYIIQASEFVKENLDFHIQNTNNIDEIIKEIVKDFSNDDNLSELDDDLLYHHLTASKILAQLAWNNYRNHVCFSNCEIDENYFYQICHHLEYEKFYKIQFEKIKKGLTYSETSITEVISRYFIIFYILKRRQVDVENIKICVYCDNEEIGDICSVCHGNQFSYKDVNDWPMKSSPSNKNKSSREPEKSNPNFENKSIYCQKETLLNNDNIENNKLDFNSEYEVKIFDQCFPGKTIDGDETEICKIKSQSPDSVPSFYKESQLSGDSYGCNFSNKNIEELLKDKRFENLSNDKTNENSNDYLLFWTCHKCNFNRNAENIQSCTFCKTDKINSEVDNETNLNLSDIKTDYNLSNIDPMDTNQWKCSQCSLINNKPDDICVLCYTNKDNMNYQLPQETWNCKKCNEKNPFDCYKCYKCNAFSDFFDKWVCEKCSYFNNKLESNCYVCQVQNQYLTKCSKCKVINVNTKYGDICISCEINDLLEKTTRLSINNYDDHDTRVRSNSKPSMISNDSGKVEINKFNCRSTNFVSKQCEMKTKTFYDTSKENYFWFCKNTGCCGVNFKTVAYCDRCHLKKDSSPLNNAVCAFYKNNKEIFEWYCSNCKSFNNASSENCSVCKMCKMKITEV